MEAKKNTQGRTKEENMLSESLWAKCTKAERKIIEDKAKLLNFSLSRYLRETCLKQSADIKIKIIPREILVLKGTLNQLAANINQLAKKRNRDDELTAAERSELTMLVAQVRQLVTDIKNHLQ